MGNVPESLQNILVGENPTHRFLVISMKQPKTPRELRDWLDTLSPEQLDGTLHVEDLDGELIPIVAFELPTEHFTSKTKSEWTITLMAPARYGKH